MDPLVSVIIPAYNMAGFTVKTVESLLAQTYPSVEVIVVDDGSADGTRGALQSFKDRILYHRQQNRGACSARNRGFALAKGEIIAFLDCDDYYHPEKIERFVALFLARPALGMVYSPEYLVHADGRIFDVNGPTDPPSGAMFERLLKGNFIGSSTPMIRREALERVGLWDEGIFTTADWDLWLRVARRFEVGYIDRPLSYSRQASLYNRRNMERTRGEGYYVLEKLGRDGAPERLMRLSRSNLEILLHHYALENGDRIRAVRHLIGALRACPLNARALFLLAASVFTPPIYRALLRHRGRRRLSRWEAAAR